jgi:hypothetical protein
LWNKLALEFEIEAIGFDGTIHPLEQEMENYAAVWKDIALQS